MFSIQSGIRAPSELGLLAIQYMHICVNMHCKPVGSPPLSVIRMEFLAVFNREMCMMCDDVYLPRSDLDLDLDLYLYFLYSWLYFSYPNRMKWGTIFIDCIHYFFIWTLCWSFQTNFIYPLAWPPGELTSTMSIWKSEVPTRRQIFQTNKRFIKNNALNLT